MVIIYGMKRNILFVLLAVMVVAVVVLLVFWQLMRQYVPDSVSVAPVTSPTAVAAQGSVCGMEEDRPASAVTLKASQYYAADAVRVYSLNPEAVHTLATAIPGADPKTFAPYDTEYEGYSHDAAHVYWIQCTVSGADPSTFTVLHFKMLQGDMRESGYGKDATHVFYQNKMLDDADPKTFVLVAIDNSHVEPAGGYAKDKNYVYLDDKRVSGADPATFVSYDDPNSILEIAKDKHSVYFGTTTVSGVDAATFSLVLDSSGYSTDYAKDKNHVYHYNTATWTFSVVSDANPKTFVPPAY